MKNKARKTSLEDATKLPSKSKQKVIKTLVPNTDRSQLSSLGDAKIEEKPVTQETKVSLEQAEIVRLKDLLAKKTSELSDLNDKYTELCKKVHARNAKEDALMQIVEGQQRLLRLYRQEITD
jgi:hypothetical protein